MLLLILIFILILILGYTVLPYLLTSLFGYGVFRKGSQSSYIALTFDDGPDRHYTPQLLDLLKKHQVKATFFVVGKKAANHPDLIWRMHQEGHLIGLHNYVHRSNWTMSPWRIKRDLDRSADIVEKITGCRPIYYRPPWGLLAVFDFFLLKRYNIILWSLMTGDWRSKGGSAKIKNGILNHVKNGDVILLHDSGETWGANLDAPSYTIEALKDVLAELPKRGFSYQRIDEMMNGTTEHMLHKKRG
ncbi:polysaccharide deacetylase family protein [Heyndrickxia acidicola]